MSTIQIGQLTGRRPLTPAPVCTVLCAGLLFSAISLKLLPAPWMLIAIYWASSSSFFYKRIKAEIWKALSFNVGFLSALLGCLEAYSYLTLPPAPTFSVAPAQRQYMRSNDILGYGPVPRTMIHLRKLIGSHIIYDVKYTIGDDGLRVTKRPNEFRDSRGCILFFGGSYTFGEGVEDSDSMPYIVSRLSKRRTYNFGFHGYGPHQMLAAIERGMVDEVVDCKPQSIIYQALLSHIARSAGYASWDKHGPKYTTHDGHVQYAGHFDDHQSRLSRVRDELLWQLSKSYSYRKFIDVERYFDTEKDITLFLEIVDASRRGLATRYPGAQFHLILWDFDADESTLASVSDGLSKRAVNTHLMSSILPSYVKKRSEYEISSYDHHPNPLAHRLIAEYVVREIVSAE